MAKPTIWDWSRTPGSNADTNSIDISGATGLVKNGDNAIRENMARTGDLLFDLGAQGAVAGTNTITLTAGSAITAYATGQRFSFKAANSITGAATLNVNSIGAKAVRKISGGTDVALIAGDIAAGRRYEVVYDATANSAAGAWILLNHGGTIDLTGGQIAFPAAATTSADANTIDAFAVGTYTPTLTNTTNIDSTTAHVTMYMRIKNMVYVAGYVGVDATATGNTVVGMSLPIASNIAAIEDIGGSAVGSSSAAGGFGIFGDAANDRATFQGIINTTSAVNYHFAFVYLVK